MSELESLPGNQPILEVRHLLLISLVAAEGTLTGAARRLGLTQPALSHQLKDLERRLGTSLFLRLGRSMELTPAGERVLGVADDVLGRLREAELDVRRMAAGCEGVIRVSTECYTCYHWLPDVIYEFRASHPDVSVDIVAEATRDPLPALREGRIDLAILTEAVDDPRLDLTPLFEDEKVALVAPGHRLCERPFLEPRDFAGEHLIVYRASENTVLQRFIRAGGVEPARVSEVTVTEGILQLVKVGLGVTVLARWAALPDIAAGRLVPLRLGPSGIPRRWYAATRRDRPPYLDRFIRLIAETPAESRLTATA